MASQHALVFDDRADAGRRLAVLLAGFAAARPVVLGLPRGGVPVAAQVARVLRAPLDVILVRKLGVPYQPELAFGAIGEGGVRVTNEEVRHVAGVRDFDLAAAEARERGTLERMARVFRGGRPPIPLQGRTVVLVDDGIATGATARAACTVARAHGAARIVLAAPVIPSQTLGSLRDVADDLVCVESPDPFFAIGQWYADFSQTSDAEVVRLLEESGHVAPSHGDVGEAVVIPLPSGASLSGELAVPIRAEGIVVFAHGSGSTRSSPRNRRVAQRLRSTGMGTLLFDLLSPDEGEDRANVFDIELLSDRLVAATATARGLLPSLPMGYFGASTGAAAALWAAAADTSIAAVVSRGGRPDLAGPRLADLRAPTLLIVGADDPVVLELNRQAISSMQCERELIVVEGASHLFEEPGTLARAADAAADWFSAHLRGKSRSR